MNLKVGEFVGFCQIFFRNDFTVRIKRAELNWVSPIATLANIQHTELYKVYKNCYIRSCGIVMDENVINIYITC